jgi:hypothetical protein
MRQRDKEKENKSDGSSLGVSKAQEDTVWATVLLIWIPKLTISTKLDWNLLCTYKMSHPFSILCLPKRMTYFQHLGGGTKSHWR